MAHIKSLIIPLLYFNLRKEKLGLVLAERLTYPHPVEVALLELKLKVFPLNSVCVILTETSGIILLIVFYKKSVENSHWIFQSSPHSPF